MKFNFRFNKSNLNQYNYHNYSSFEISKATLLDLKTIL